MGDRSHLCLIGDDEAVIALPAEQRVNATLRACSIAIDAAASPAGIFDQLLRIAIPTVADWGAVYERNSPLATRFALTLTYPFSRSAIEGLLDLESAATRNALGVRQATDCGSTQRRSITTHFRLGHYDWSDPTLHAAIAATRPVDALAVPLRMGESTMAVILLARTRDSFRSDDLSIVGGLRTIIDRTLTRLAAMSGMQAWARVTRCH